MSLIHVARHGQSLGTFNEDDLRQGMSQKRFHPEDLVWKQGMPDWRPLSEMAEDWNWNNPTLNTGETAEPPLPALLPWEEIGKRRFFNAFFQTWKAVLFSPKKTFAHLDTTGGFTAPLSYYVINTAAVFIATLLFFLPQILKSPASIAPQLAAYSQKAIITGFVGLIVVAPLLFVIGILVSTAVTHISLKILGVARKSFTSTLRVICYSFGSTSFFQMIPVVGGVVGALWGLTLYFIGLKEVYSLSKWRAFFVILLSVLIYLLLVVFVAVVISAFYTGSGAATPAS